MLTKFRGIIAAMLTPLKENNDLDLEAMKQLVDFLIDKGINGLFILGTTGEGMLLSTGQRKKFTQSVVENVAGRVPVLVHATHLEVEKLKELIAHSREIGADAAAILPLPSFMLSEEMTENYLSKILKAFPDFPIFLYIFSQLTGNKISPQMILKLKKLNANLTGVKISDPDLMSIQELLLEENKLAVFAGCDNLGFSALALGATGIVSGPASVFPEPYVQLDKAILNKNFDEAKKQQRIINEISSLLQDDIVLFKKALSLRGICEGNIRESLSSGIEKENFFVSSIREFLRKIDYERNK